MADDENRRSLNVSFGLNASEFSRGVAEVKQELSRLNAKFIENKQKVSDTSKELKELHKQEEKLKAEIVKSGEATEEQKRQMQELSEKIAQTTAKMGQLKAEEADIKSGIKAATGELQNQRGALDNNTKSANLLQKALGKLGTAAKGFIISYILKKMVELNSITKEYNSKIESIENSSRNAIANSQAEISVLENKVERYDELRTAAELNTEQHAELKSIAEELQDVFGDEVDVVNKTTGAYNDLSVALENYSEKKLAQTRVDAAYSELQEDYKLLSELQDKKEKYDKKFTDKDYEMAAYFASGNAPDWLLAVDAGILTAGDIAQKITTFGLSNLYDGKNGSVSEHYEYAKTISQMDEVNQRIAEKKESCKELDAALYQTSEAADSTAKCTENLSEAYESNKEAVESLAKSLSTVNSAYREQTENGKLSYNTVMSLIDAGYASCLQIDGETGAVKLNTEAYKELAKAKIQARMADLQTDIAENAPEISPKMRAKMHLLYPEMEFDENEKTKAAKAELAALRELYNNLDNHITNDGGSSKKSGSGYSNAYSAYKTEADKKIDLIKKELAVKKELRDKTIEYLDEEIQKRKELNQDDDMQKEIDKIKAQLDYAQLDDFSRGQLEKQLQKAEEERQEVLWQREMQRKKDEANAAYSAAADNAAKAQEQISNAVNTVKSIMDNLANGITNIGNVINNNVNNTSNTANINLASQYLTMAQITKAVKDALIGTVLIR